MIRCVPRRSVLVFFVSAAIVLTGSTANAAPVADPVTVSSFTADRTSPIPSGTEVILTAVATGGTAPLEYQFWQYASPGGWTIVRAYSPANTFTWAPDDAVARSYSFQVWVRSAGSTDKYEGWRDLGPFEVVISSPLIESFACSTGPLYVPTSVTCSVTSQGGDDVEYQVPGATTAGLPPGS